MEWALAIGREHDLAPPARHVLQALAYYANRRTGEAWPGTPTLAAATGYGESTVWRALGDIEAAGLLERRRRHGMATVWAGYPQEAAGFGNPSRSESYPSRSESYPSRSESRTKEEPMSNPTGARGAQWGKPDQTDIDGCQYCDEMGFLWVGDTVAGRCSHERAVSDLTVADVLGEGVLDER
jgi:DNA-binding transcriptional MocR family regulator